MLELKITCEEKWFAAQEAARAHYDETLDKCVIRLLHWMHARSNVKAIYIGQEWGEHCFSFQEIREDGTTGIRGGIIFHGFPGEGYTSNGSIQLSPSYGWQIHT